MAREGNDPSLASLRSVLRCATASSAWTRRMTTPRARPRQPGTCGVFRACAAQGARSALVPGKLFHAGRRHGRKCHRHTQALERFEHDTPPVLRPDKAADLTRPLLARAAPPAGFTSPTLVPRSRDTLTLTVHRLRYQAVDVENYATARASDAGRRLCWLSQLHRPPRSRTHRVHQTVRRCPVASLGDRRNGASEQDFRTSERPAMPSRSHPGAHS